MSEEQQPSPQTRWNNANKLTLWAHGAVRSAIRRGIIERKPCEVCGTVENVDAHHDDYGRPLSIRWLCRLHHRHAHRKVKTDTERQVGGSS